MQEREAQEKAERGLRSYKQQMSFGLHVVVMMGTFYAFGHALGMAIGPSGTKLYVSLGSLVGCAGKGEVGRGHGSQKYVSF